LKIRLLRDHRRRDRIAHSRARSPNAVFASNERASRYDPGAGPVGPRAVASLGRCSKCSRYIDAPDLIGTWVPANSLTRYSVSSLSFKDHRKFVVAAANAARRKSQGRSFRRAIYHDVPFSDVSPAIRSVLITVHHDGTHACKSIRAHYLNARHRRTRGTRGNAAFIGGCFQHM